jgi:hypothetical protein
MLFQRNITLLLANGGSLRVEFTGGAELATLVEKAPRQVWWRRLWRIRVLEKAAALGRGGEMPAGGAEARWRGRRGSGAALV